MKRVSGYETSDGRFFDNAQDARQHERTTSLLKVANQFDDDNALAKLLENKAEIVKVLSAIIRTEKTEEATKGEETGSV